MNRDRIERALREPGPRERGYSQEALPGTAAELRARVPRRNRLVMSAGALGGFAAAVAAGAVIAVVLSRGVASGPGTGGTVSRPTPTPTAVLTPAPTPTSSPAPVAACRAGDFAWNGDPWGGAAGSRGTTVLARAVATLAPCELHGEATLTLRDAKGVVLATGHTAATNTRVDAGQVFQVGVSWSNWCGSEPAQSITLALTLPGDTTEVPLIPSGGAMSVPPCNGPGQPTVLGGTNFQPSDRAPEG